MINFRFRKLNIDRDLAFLYEIYSDNNETSLFSLPLIFTDYQSFKNVILEKTYESLLFRIIESDNGDLLGLIYAHNYKPSEKAIRFTICVQKNYRMYGIGAICAIEYVKLLFESLPLEKVIVTILSSNQHSLLNSVKFGFLEETTLNKIININGKEEKMVFLSITKSSFYQRYSHFINSQK